MADRVAKRADKEEVAAQPVEADGLVERDHMLQERISAFENGKVRG
jgi:hypothetical protein